MAKPQNQGPKNGPVGSGTRITRVKNTVTTTQMTTADKTPLIDYVPVAFKKPLLHPLLPSLPEPPRRHGAVRPPPPPSPQSSLRAAPPPALRARAKKNPTRYCCYVILLKTSVRTRRAQH